MNAVVRFQIVVNSSTYDLDIRLWQMLICIVYSTKKDLKITYILSYLIQYGLIASAWLISVFVIFERSERGKLFNLKSNDWDLSKLMKKRQEIKWTRILDSLEPVQILKKMSREMLLKHLRTDDIYLKAKLRSLISLFIFLRFFMNFIYFFNSSFDFFLFIYNSILKKKE